MPGWAFWNLECVLCDRVPPFAGFCYRSCGTCDNINRHSRALSAFRRSKTAVDDGETFTAALAFLQHSPTATQTPGATSLMMMMFITSLKRLQILGR